MTRVQQVSARTLQVDVTANLGMHVPPDATQAEIEAALAVAQLSKDQGIGNLSWSRTTQALGADARIVEDGVTTQVRLPDEERPPIWPAVVFPILACALPPSTGPIASRPCKSQSDSQTWSEDSDLISE